MGPAANRHHVTISGAKTDDHTFIAKRHKTVQHLFLTNSEKGYQMLA
jgi:hypothetical protein